MNRFSLLARVRVRRLCVSVLAVGSAICASVTSPLATSAAVPTADGGCVVAGDMQATFSAALTPLPGSIGVSVAGTATCAGNDGVTTVTLGLGGTLTLSCEGGTGSLFGTMSWSPSPPNGGGVQAVVVAGATGMVMAITGLGITANADLVWTNVAGGAECPLGGTTSTPLAGAITFLVG